MREIEPADVDDADQYAAPPPCVLASPAALSIAAAARRVGGGSSFNGSVGWTNATAGSSAMVPRSETGTVAAIRLRRRSTVPPKSWPRAVAAALRTVASSCGNRARVIVRRHTGAFGHEFDHHVHKRIVWRRLRLERLTFRQPGRAGAPAAQAIEVLRRGGGERRCGQDSAGGLGGCGRRGDRRRHVGAERIDLAVAVGDDAKARMETTGRSVAVGHGFSCHIRRTRGPTFPPIPPGGRGQVVNRELAAPTSGRHSRFTT